MALATAPRHVPVDHVARDQHADRPYGRIRRQSGRLRAPLAPGAGPRPPRAHFSHPPTGCTRSARSSPPRAGPRSHAPCLAPSPRALSARVLRSAANVGGGHDGLAGGGKPVLAMRDYQRAAVEGVERELRQGITCQLIVLPTGCGKTVIFCHVARRPRAGAGPPDRAAGPGGGEAAARLARGACGPHPGRAGAGGRLPCRGGQRAYPQPGGAAARLLHHGGGGRGAPRRGGELPPHPRRAGGRPARSLAAGPDGHARPGGRLRRAAARLGAQHRQPQQA